MTDMNANYRRVREKFAAILFIGGVCVSIGCGNAKDQSSTNPATLSRSDGGNHSSKVADNSHIDFDGRTWFPISDCEGPGNIVRLSMHEQCYSAGDPTERLVELVARDGGGEGVYSRILLIQRWDGSRWNQDGAQKHWLLDGTYGESSWKNNTLHGTQREWYADGSLKLERGWYEGDMHGQFKQYEPDGSVLVDAEYVYGEEVKSGDPNAN